MRCETCHRDVPEDAVFCPYCAGKLRGDEAEPAAFEYAAFISYRHLPRDQEVAKRVQQAIETYRLPRSASPEAGGARLGKCFRDEDELAAAHSLPDRILDALSKSGSLVVICTPETSESAWVRREVEAFIEMRGRERVFAVLAKGSSAESIPEYLRTNMPSAGNDERAPSNPLAADMRPESSGKTREETLRLIAAIANCGFDDLRQRDRARRRKRNAVVAVAAILVVAAIAAALAFASSARQDALAAESRKLAAESEQLLAQGDRYGALEKALEALPRSESSNDRPYVPEARTALENALEIGEAGDALWLASYEIRTEAPLGLIGNTYSRQIGTEEGRAGAVAVSDAGGFFAVSDSDGNVSTYDTLTGRKLADCVMPEETTPLSGGLYARSMGATEHYLLVGSGNDRGGATAWFDARTGEQIGASSGTGRPSFNTSYGADLVSMCTPFADGGYGVVIADLEAGRSSGSEFRDEGVLATDTPYFNTPGSRFGTNYSAFGNRLFLSELDTETNKSVTLVLPCATSLAYIDGLVVAASADPMPSDEIARRFAIEAFNEEVELKWSYEGSFSSEMIENNGIRSLVTGEPVVCAPIGNGNGVAVSVGREVLLLDPDTGEIIDRVSFEQTVIDEVAFTNEDGCIETIIAACANGTVHTRDFFEGSLDPDGDGRLLSLPFPLRWARVAHLDGYAVLLAIPADSEDRIISFRTDWTRGTGDDTEYSLDELIEQANGVLASGGRTR
ncbi:MAG: TIR domain-containing protein [Eggerthellaceae bacterium]|nr:TIR domain-containing protein [Eggerthellaceae bacterium]